MQGNIRQWFVDNPQALNAAFALMLSTSVAFEIGIQDAIGATSGP